MNYVSGGVIKLDSNLLPYLDSAAFQSIVNFFKDNNYATSYISVANSKNCYGPLLDLPFLPYFLSLFGWKYKG